MQKIWVSSQGSYKGAYPFQARMNNHLKDLAQTILGSIYIFLPNYTCAVSARLVSLRSALWFRFSASCKSSALVLGLTNRNALSECGGPNKGSESPRCTAVNGEQMGGEHSTYTKDTKSQNYRKLSLRSLQMSIAIAITLVTSISEIMYNNTAQWSHHTPSSRQYMPSSAFPNYCRSPIHKSGPNLAEYSHNWMIQSELASLGA